MENWIIGQRSVDEVVSHIVRLHAEQQQRFVVCFDYFDTLVTRTVEPEYTKVLSANLLSRALPGEFDGHELYSFRRDLELELTKRNAAACGELDFRLDHLGLQLFHILKERCQLINRLTPEQFADLLVDIELAVEKSVQMVCPELLAVVEELSQKRIPLILASDFYLPERAFREMAAHLGLDRYFHDFFISAEQGKGKGSSGALYEEITHRLGCRPGEILMIGDNPHADIAMARRWGLHTLQVIRPERQALLPGARLGKLERNVSEAEPFAGLSLPETVFAEMGVSLWLFVHRLFTVLREQGGTEVFFLAKEGEYLQQLFVQYQQQLFNKVLIRPHYLLASRKATFIASLRPLVAEDFHRLFDHYRDISLREFLLSLNFRAESVESITSQLSCDCDRRLADTVTHPDFLALCRLPQFQEDYEELRQTQADNFRCYLDSFHCDFRATGLHLVDVGWKGSIQDNIYHILGGRTTVHGYYIGSLNATELVDNNRKTGLLFENAHGPSPFFNVYNNNRSLFEMLLGASHGSADCYLTPAQLTAKRRPGSLTIHQTRETGKGPLHLMVLDLPEERDLYVRIIKPIQEHLFKLFVTITSAFLTTECRHPDAKWFARHHARMVFLPKSEEIDLYQQMYHLENFGIFEFTDFNVSHNFTLFERLNNLKNILRHPGVLESGVWPPVILRRFGVGFWQCIDGRWRFLRAFNRLSQ
jgi:FMN phosphatase YigB (HAD superfamily)